jgi:hypothetical protein
MKACAFTGSVGVLVALTAFIFSGCGGGSAESPPASAPSGSTPEDSAPPPTTSSAAATDAPPAGSAAATDEAPADLGAGDSRTMDSIAALVKAHRKEARECYEKALKQIPGLKGDLVIHFILKPNGEVKQAELNEPRSTIREASVSSCVIEVIRKIEFPKSSKGLETTVNYPFNFNP